MKNLKVCVLALAGVLAVHSCQSKANLANQPQVTELEEQQENVEAAEIAENGLHLEHMDRSVRPQDDFYNYVNGGWMKQATIPSDRSRWGSFDELRERTDEASLSILNNILDEYYAAGTEGKKIQDLYASYVDTDKRNKEGISPIKADLAKIDKIKSLKDLQAFLNESTKTGYNPFYNWSVFSDLKSSKDNAVYLGGPSLGLGKDYYQKTNEDNTKVLAEYTKYVAQMLDVLGYKNSTAVAEKIVKFEKDLAQNLLTVEQSRNANLRYNPKTTAELSTLVKNVNLPSYLKTVGVNTDRVILSELKYYETLDKFISNSNITLLKDYMKLKLLAGNSGYLDKNVDDINFNFYNKYLQGQKEQRSLDKRALGLVNGVLGEAFGKIYVDKYFPEEAKKEMLTIVDYLKKSYQVHISNLEWMSPETKQKALEKLSKFNVKIAYPDNWEDYSKLVVESPSNGASLYSNLKNVSQWSYSKKLEKVGHKVDRSKWGMTPQTVNAYYSASNNEIVFPAAILQAPFFDFKADPAVNFGGIGAVIGHEISHGFDDSGSRFDGDGNLNNWWTDQDKKNFENATNKLVDQFAKYEPVAGTFVNGQFTLGENIADLGGVAISYDALQMYLKDKGNPGKISGFTQEQRFFMSWATVWRTKTTDQALINQVKTDPHTPGLYRAFGPLVNVDAFYKAFDVKPGDKLYKKPEERIKIW